MSERPTARVIVTDAQSHLRPVLPAGYGAGYETSKCLLSGTVGEKVSTVGGGPLLESCDGQVAVIEIFQKKNQLTTVSIHGIVFTRFFKLFTSSGIYRYLLIRRLVDCQGMTVRYQTNSFLSWTNALNAQVCWPIPTMGGV